MNPLFRMDGSFMEAIDAAFVQIPLVHDKTDNAEMVMASSKACCHPENHNQTHPYWF